VIAVTQARSASAGIGHLVLTGAAQAGIQLLAFASGLLVIRYLPLQEYAYYTIANAVLGTLIVLTDSGISQGVMARGGKVWTNAHALGAVLASGLQLRRRFGLFAAAISLPLLGLLLHRQGASTATALLVTVSIVPLFLSTLTGQLFEVVPRLHQRLRVLQSIQFAGAALRLATLGAAIWALPSAWFAGIAAGFAQLWTTWRLRKLAGEMATPGLAPDARVVADITAQVRRTAPGAVYFAFAGQISVWLISLLGTTDSVAHVGALGRLAMAFNVLTAVVSLVVVPRFARMSQGAGHAVLSRFWQVQGGLLALLAAVVGVVAAFPQGVLLVLGDDYASLTLEIVLAAAGGALAMVSGSAYSMAAARGVVAPAWIVVPLALAMQGALIVLLPIGTVSGVVWLGLLTNLAYWMLHTFYFTRTAVHGAPGASAPD